MPRTSLRTAALRFLLALACALSASATLGACGSSHRQGSRSADARSSQSTATRSPAADPGGLGASPGAVPSEAALAADPASLPSSSGGPGSGKVIASVQGMKITLGELLHQMATLGPTKTQVPDPPSYSACIAEAGRSSGERPAQLKRACEGRYEKLKRQALNLLIHARWLSLQARKYGLTVDEAALDRELAQEIALAAKAGQTLASSGRTLTDVKYWQRIQQLSFLLYEHIKQKAPKASARRVAEYYAQNKKSFSSPQRRDLHLIRTDSRASAEHALEEIRSGRSFQSVVKEVSTHQPIYTKEGSIKDLSYTSYSEPHLSSAIFRARPGVLSGPVKLDASNAPKIAFGYFIFEVTAIHPAVQRSLAQVRAQIAARLPEILFVQSKKAYVAQFKRSWRRRSDCRPGFVVEDCRQYRGRLPFEDAYTL